MRQLCVDCNIESKDKNRVCWKEFNRCIKCAVKKFPDKFPKQLVHRYRGKVKRVSYYFVCPSCKNTCNALAYWKKGTTVNTKK